MTPTYPTTPRVKQLTGGTKKRQFFLSIYDVPYEVSVNSYWDGGSKTNYSKYNYKTGAWIPINTNPGFPKFESKTTSLEPGTIVISTGIFCGKTATPRITCRYDEAEEVKKYLGIIVCSN